MYKYEHLNVFSVLNSWGPQDQEGTKCRGNRRIMSQTAEKFASSSEANKEEKQRTAGRKVKSRGGKVEEKEGM